MSLVRRFKNMPVQLAAIVAGSLLLLILLKNYEWRTSPQYTEFLLESVAVLFWLVLLLACTKIRHLPRLHYILLAGTSISFLGSLLDATDELLSISALHPLEDFAQSIGIIITGFGLWQLLQHQQHEQQRLQQLALTDPLTGALNRRSFRPNALNNNGVFALVDVDHFKQINDRLGHDAGDYVLVELSRLISSNIRGDDLFFRWGGEEFLLEFNGISLLEATKRMEVLRNLVESSYFNFAGTNIHITISAGVAAIPTGQGGIEQAIKSADQALYRAKEAGRNQVLCA